MGAGACVSAAGAAAGVSAGAAGVGDGRAGVAGGTECSGWPAGRAEGVTVMEAVAAAGASGPGRVRESKR